MKNLFHIIVCVSALLSISSCDYFSTEDSHQATKDTVFVEPNLEEIKSEITGIKADIKLLFRQTDSLEQTVAQIQNVIAAVEEQDTVMNGRLSERIDSMAQVLSDVQTQTAALQKQVKESKDADSVGGKLSLAALVLAVISLIITIFLFWNRIGKEKINEIFKHNLDESTRIKELQDKVDCLKREGEKTSRQIKEVLYYRPLKDGDTHKNTSKTQDTHNTPPHQQEPAHEQPKYIRKEYAKINGNGPYFTETFDSQREGCAFLINITDEKHGEFSIISLDALKSSNGWEKVIKYTGCSITEATGYTVKKCGICEKRDGQVWEVANENKLEIELKK